MARAALTSATTQGLAVVMSMQKEFSWKSVAASAVGAGVGKYVGEKLTSTFQNQDWGSFDPLKGITSGTLTGFAAGMTTAAMHGGKIDVIRVATDAFGNALGSSMADAMKSQSNLDKLMAKARADLKPVDVKWNLQPDILEPIPLRVARDEQLGQSENRYPLQDDVFPSAEGSFSARGNSDLFATFLPEAAGRMNALRMPSNPMFDGINQPSFVASGKLGNGSGIHTDAKGNILYMDTASGNRRVYTHSVSMDEFLDPFGGGIRLGLGKEVGTLLGPYGYQIGDQINLGQFNADQTGFSLGLNERYHNAIGLASQRTGLSGATIASVISSEADKYKSGTLKGVWNPNSYNEESGALGLTQFLGTTWLDEAKRPGTYLNEQARLRGLVNSKNQVMDKSSLLELRRDPTLSIVAAAEYDQSIFAKLSREIKPDGTPLIPKGLSDRDAAHYLYLGHHEGEDGAKRLLLGTISENWAKTKLIPQNIPPSQQAGYYARNGGIASKAYTSWFWNYTSKRINPSEFYPAGGKR